MGTFYEKLVHIGVAIQPYLLLAMRLYWGLAFFYTGMGKFHNHDQIVQYFQSLGIPFAGANVYLVSTIETVGGLCIALGFASRLVALPLIAILLGAYLTAHRAALLNIFHDPDTFISQPPFNFLVMCVVVFCFGPGKISFDRFIWRKGA